MNDEHLKQRIAYLVEHGGIADADPLEGIRRDVRILYFLVVVTLTLDMAQAIKLFA